MDTMISLNQPAPVFSLPDLDGVMLALGDQRGGIVVLNFWSVECPWAERADQELLTLMPGWGHDVTLWSIASNTNESEEQIRQVAASRGLPLVLCDNRSRVADLYGAQTTPHLYVVDGEGVLRYQGGLDDVTWRQRTPTHFYLKEAVASVLAGRQPDPGSTRPYGCTIVRIP